MALTPVKKESISQQVFEQMKAQIMDKEWKTSEKLPSESELSEIFGVSRVTIRQAIQKLVVLGLVETRFGEGSFVKEANLGQQMKNVLLPSVYLESYSTEEVLDFRGVIEIQTAGLAARKAVAEDVSALEKILAQQENFAVHTTESFAEADLDFHMVLAKSTRNSLIIATYEILRDILRSAMLQTVSGLGYEVGIPYHRGLIEALEKHNEEMAIRVMREHVDKTKQGWLQLKNSG